MSELVVGSLKGLSSKGFVIDVASGSKLVQSGSILQVVSTTKSDTFSTTSTSYVEVTGLTATITPSRTTSLILVTTMVPMSVSGGGSTDRSGFLTVFRGATNLSNPTSPGSRTRAFHSQFNMDTTRMMNAVSVSFLDSPASTSSLTYGIRVAAGISETIRVNSSQTDGDVASSGRAVATITLMEVAG